MINPSSESYRLLRSESRSNIELQYVQVILIAICTACWTLQIKEIRVHATSVNGVRALQRLAFFTPPLISARISCRQ
jgi:hypothetical protein